MHTGAYIVARKNIHDETHIDHRDHYAVYHWHLCQACMPKELTCTETAFNFSFSLATKKSFHYQPYFLCNKITPPN